MACDVCRYMPLTVWMYRSGFARFSGFRYTGRSGWIGAGCVLKGNELKGNEVGVGV